MNTTQNAKRQNNILWTLQVLLAALFLMAGSMKLFQPISELAKMLPWATEFPAVMVRFIGLSELLGAIGLLLPSIFRIQPILTPIAAIGLSIVQLLAMGFHLSRGESSMIGANIVFISLAVLIAWGRLKVAPIAPK